MPNAITFANTYAGRNAVVDALTVGFVVMLAALFGILTRPSGLLASFWPANAILLGMMLRFPRFMTPMAWAAATAGYLIADLMTGGSLFRTSLLTTANMTGVLAGALLFRRLPDAEPLLSGSQALINMALVALAAATAAGVVGAIIGPVLFDGQPLNSFFMWGITELVNYIAILPVMLSMPTYGGRLPIKDLTGWPLFRKAAPIIAMVASLFVSMTVGGPGALAFPVPALLWCALTYSVFVTSLLTLAFSAWTLTVMSADYFAPLDLTHPADVLSIRMAVTLIALAPIAVSTMNAAQNELLAKLRRMADHDTLTGTLTRAAFQESAGGILRSGKSTSALMLDIDNFKSINDTHGHLAGDIVLTEFAYRVRQALREGDIISRFGGEEFAVLLHDCTQEETLRIAERIRPEISTTPIIVTDGQRINVTVSIGAAIRRRETSNLIKLLQRADQALYQAKHSGRDQVALHAT